jgi:hypothetical protein
MRKLLHKRFQTTLLMRYDLRTSMPTVVCRADLRIETLDAGGVDRLLQINTNAERLLETAKFDSGCSCYVGYLDDRLAHYSWVQDHGVHRLAGTGRSRRIDEGSLWIHACFTAEWARGRRVYPDVLRKVLADYKSRRFDTAWVYVAESNAASRSGLALAGFEVVSRLRALAIRGLTLPLP